MGSSTVERLDLDSLRSQEAGGSIPSPCTSGCVAQAGRARPSCRRGVTGGTLGVMSRGDMVRAHAAAQPLCYNLPHVGCSGPQDVQDGEGIQAGVSARAPQRQEWDDFSSPSRDGEPSRSVARGRGGGTPQERDSGGQRGRELGGDDTLRARDCAREGSTAKGTDDVAVRLPAVWGRVFQAEGASASLTTLLLDLVQYHLPQAREVQRDPSRKVRALQERVSL